MKKRNASNQGINGISANLYLTVYVQSFPLCFNKAMKKGIIFSYKNMVGERERQHKQSN